MNKVKRRNTAKNLMVDGYRPVDFEKLVMDHVNYKSELIHAMNYAVYVFELEELKSYAKEYALTLGITLTSVPAWELSHIGTISWLLLNDCWINPDNVANYNARLVALSKWYAPVENVVKIPTENINTFKLIGELEGLLDDAQNGLPINVEKFITGFGKINKEKIITHFQKELDFIKSSEEYSNSKKEIVVNTITEILDSLSGTNKDSKPKAARIRTAKPRKIVPSKMVRKLKYLKAYDSDGLVLKSIHPEKLVGSSILWVFNTKTRRLGKYIAADATGLLVKGSTITNFDVDKSTSKKLRKPKEIIDKLMSLGKVEQRTFMNDIKAVESPLTGRINADIILVKA